MSNKLRQSMQKKKELKRYCLSKDDWDKLAASLIVAEELFRKADEITDQEWTEWTSEFGASQGFPAIIYHDKPVIIRPTIPEIHKAG